MQRTVLVIDEDAVFRRALESALTPLSYRVLATGDADAAYALLAAEHIDVVLLDVGLRAMTGFGLYLAIVHQWPHLKNRVVIMASDLGVLVQPWLRRHPCATFTKPFRLQQITAWLDRAFEEPQAAPGLAG